MGGVADHLVSRMRAAGVRTLFGLPGGGGNLDVIDAAGRAGLPFVLTATETGSAIAALAQTELTSLPGACLTTLGPGVASVVNGIACAHLDRAPVLVVTDSLAHRAAAFAHQRVDHAALLGSIVKWSGRLSPDRAFETIDEGFQQLTAPPPGPVHVDCPGDFERSAGRSTALRTDQPPPRPFTDADDEATVRRLLGASRKPLVIVGLGARRVEDAAAIRAFCEAHGVPALVTYKAKGVVPDGHDWWAGVFTHGAIERDVILESDLIIGLGFDPVEILPRPWTYEQPFVSIAPWRFADDHVPFRAQWIAPVAEAVTGLAGVVTTSAWSPSRPREAAEAGRRAIRIPTAGMSAPDAVVAAARAAAGRARLTVDAGAHMFPATMLWPVSEPGGLLISNGLSTMGFALPAAIGAALTDRARPVVALTGDGGLLICLGELATVARERLKVITLVLNDASLSLIEIKQQARQLAPAGVALGDLHWRRIAEGFGLPSWTARTPDELGVAMDAALAVDGPSLIEARIDRSNYGAVLTAIRGT